MKKFPITCPICENREMFFQAIDHDDGDEIKIVGSVCRKCKKVWVLDKKNIKNHPHADDILEIEDV